MSATPSHIHSLCPDCTECPTVEVYDDGTVRIGEAPNLVTLRREEGSRGVCYLASNTKLEMADTITGLRPKAGDMHRSEVSGRTALGEAGVGPIWHVQ